METAWKDEVLGTLMFQLCCKLKKVKTMLKELNKKEFGCILERVEVARDSLESIQSWLTKDHFESGLI